MNLKILLLFLVLVQFYFIIWSPWDNLTSCFLLCDNKDSTLFTHHYLKNILSRSLVYYG